MSQYGGLLKHE